MDMTSFGTPCGACKILRRKCARDCVFAPYFSHDQGATHFAAIHKVFGASNVSKLFLHLPVSDRSEAANTITYEAQARLHDPIYGCVGHIFALQQQVFNLQTQLVSLRARASNSFVDGSTRPELFQNDIGSRAAQFLTAETTPYFENDILQTNSSKNTTGKDVKSFVENEPCSSSTYRDTEDVQSVAYAHLHRQ